MRMSLKMMWIVGFTAIVITQSAVAMERDAKREALFDFRSNGARLSMCAMLSTVATGGTSEYHDGRWYEVPSGCHTEYHDGRWYVVPPGGTMEYHDGQWYVIPAGGRAEYHDGRWYVLGHGETLEYHDGA